jgi:hypothetical protein
MDTALNKPDSPPRSDSLDSPPQSDSSPHPKMIQTSWNEGSSLQSNVTSTAAENEDFPLQQDAMMNIAPESENASLQPDICQWDSSMTADLQNLLVLLLDKAYQWDPSLQRDSTELVWDGTAETSETTCQQNSDLDS